MSSTFRIRSRLEYHATWMPSSGAFDSILHSILLELKTADNALYMLLQEYISEGAFNPDIEAFPYGNIDSLSQTQFHSFLQAAQTAYEQAIRTMRLEIVALLNSSHSIEGYDPRAVVVPFGQLIAMLRADDRAADSGDEESILNLGDKRLLSAPSWVVDFILEILANNSRFFALNQHLSAKLLEMRFHKERIIDFNDFSASEFCTLLTEIAYYEEYYEPVHGGRIGYSANFTPKMSRAIAELLKLFQANPMASHCGELSQPRSSKVSPPN